MTGSDSPDLAALGERIMADLVEGGLPADYELDLNYLPDRDIIALDLHGGPDAFEVHDLYDWRQGSESIARDILDHYEGS